MGTVCAPSNANLFLGWCEDRYVFREGLSYYTQHIIFWARFIDDDFILWDNTKALFIEFETLNKNVLGLRFTSEITEKKEIF